MTSNIGSHLIQEAFEDVNDENVEQATRRAKLRLWIFFPAKQ